MNFQFDIPEFKLLLSEIQELRKEVKELRKEIKPPPPKNDRLIMSKEVLTILGISKRTLYNLEVKGTINYVQTNVGSKKRYSLREIEKYRDSLLK